MRLLRRRNGIWTRGPPGPAVTGGLSTSSIKVKGGLGMEGVFSFQGKRVGRSERVFTAPSKTLRGQTKAYGQ